MPLRLNIKQTLTARSDRVKSIDLHPTEPWMLISLYSGVIVVWNQETQIMVKTFELCEAPVRAAKFVARKNWIVAGADDMHLHVFNYNTMERVQMFEAHSDYIRSIAVHPTLPYILTSSDDITIKLWDWDKKWECSQVFEGHTHYVMQIVFNPKDNNQFASASLDRTVKVWQLGSKTPNFTLEGHQKGVNCIDYYSGGDKPYLVSGADDHLVKIWDYQNKTCVQTLEGHNQNVTCVCFHPELPIILTGSEDGTVRVWHSNTYRLEEKLTYGMDRVWYICGQPGSNSVALGYDEGTIIIKLGREEPAMSMDSSGKIMWARHSEVQQANLKALGEAEINDGEKLPLGIKDMGSCEIYPQTIQHSPNGRFVVVCGDGEYIIYTAMALRNKSFGLALEFVWAQDSSQYATRESSNMVKIFKNFKEKKAFKPDFRSEGIFGGLLLGVRSNSGLAFYDWENATLICRIETQPKHIFWSDSGELVCIATGESFFVLRYLSERVVTALESTEEMAQDGIEDAFEVIGEVQEEVRTAVWVGDCFIYTTSVNRLSYYVGGEIITIAHLDRTMYLLGYITKDDRLYLGDKELNIVSYSLMLSVLEYQTAVMRKDFSTTDKVLPTIPKEQRTRVAHFLEKQGFRQQALAVTMDSEHKFDLALQLGELKIAYQLALDAQSEQKWKQLAEIAATKSQFSLAQECLYQAHDYGGLLLLATSSGSTDLVGQLAEGAERDGKTNVAFLTYFIQGRLDKCLDLLIKTNRLPEAAFLARSYMPSQVSRVVKLWKQSLSKVNQKAADALADPTHYTNLFPGLQQALLAEQYLKESHSGVRPAAEYPLITPNEDCSVLEQCAGFIPKEKTSESEIVVKSKPLITPTETEVACLEAAPVEEPVSPAQNLADPGSAPSEAVPLSVTAKEFVTPKQAPNSAFLETETLGSVEKVEIPTKKPEMLENHQLEVVVPSDMNGAQEMAQATAAPPATCVIKTETTTGAEKTEATAGDDLLVSTDLTADPTLSPEYQLVEEMTIKEEFVTDISSEVPHTLDPAGTQPEETPVTEEFVSAATAVMVSKGTIPLEASDAPVPRQFSSELSHDPLFDSSEDTIQVPVQASEHEEQETVKPDDKSEPEVLHQAESDISPTVETHGGSDVEEEGENETGSEESEEPEAEAQLATFVIETEKTTAAEEPNPEETEETAGDDVPVSIGQALEHKEEMVKPDKSEPEVLHQAELDITPTVETHSGSDVEKEEGKNEKGAEESEEPEDDVELEINDEDLDNLDLDSFDLEDIDTTDINLDLVSE
ncbi:coatomer subunit beta'-like isoform 2-T2 [Pholidichthys leucotaenia]